jgi:hypothetical protein
MRCRCPYCCHRFWQARNLEGAQFCRQCHRLFVAPPEAKVPPWILGVVVILMGNWQIMTHRPVAVAAMQAQRQCPDLPRGQTPVSLRSSGLCQGSISHERSTGLA